MTSDLETNIISVERVKNYIDMPKEVSLHIIVKEPLARIIRTGNWYFIHDPAYAISGQLKPTDVYWHYSFYHSFP